MICNWLCTYRKASHISIDYSFTLKLNRLTKFALDAAHTRLAVLLADSNGQPIAIPARAASSVAWLEPYTR